ncbi:Uncharacterised protein [Citrobacter koseri]|nr:Uncharacterised protein [Citrobacter koseri]
MRKLPIPTIIAVDILRLCSLSIRDETLKVNLRLIEGEVDNAEVEYRERAIAEELYLIKANENIGEDFTGKQMERVYNNTFVKSKKTRFIYDQLKKVCENDICPLCGQGTVYQLDHYLPISCFPIYGVSPINLIPACADCNKRKSIYVADAANKQTLHPYFDDIDNERWLYASVIEIQPPALQFYIEPPAHWGDVISERILAHFKAFGLAALYATHAAVEITNIRYSLQRIAVGENSAKNVRDHLIDKAESCMHARLNSWQTATYDALEKSDWFCNGGFNIT